MVKHVVIGAGLGGLYTVARLLNYGVALEHIIVIDPRANHYTRPGHLSVDVFSLFQEKTGIRTDNYSSAHHIKELERQMYACLDSIDVQFIKERFIALQEQTSNQSKAVITEKEDGTHGIYPADVVFDCTGKPAYVAQAVNRYQQEAGFGPFFYSSLLTDLNPDTDHLIAQVRIANSSDLLNFFPLLTTTKHTEPKHYRQGTAEKNIETREQLKLLGWPYEAFPAFYTYPQEGTDKLCLYMETPPDLTVELQPAWITLLLRIYSNDKVNEYTELEPSQKYEKKPRILGFKSTPYLLNRTVFWSDDLPIVLVGFDALKGSDYRRANGIKSGVECFELTLKNITIRDGRIQYIDAGAIEEDILNYMTNEHRETLDYILGPRQKAIEKGYSYFSEMYTKAAQELPPAEYIKKHKYQSIAGELAYQDALIQFQALVTRYNINIDTLNKCLSLFLKVRQNIPAHQTLAHYDINNKLQELIHRLRFEIMALNIDGILRNIYVDHAQLLAIFESVYVNFQQLDGSFASQAIHQKTISIIEKILQKMDLLAQSKNPLAYGKGNEALLSRLKSSTGFSFFRSSQQSPSSSNDIAATKNVLSKKSTAASSSVPDSIITITSSSDVSDTSDSSNDYGNNDDNLSTQSYTPDQ